MQVTSSQAKAGVNVILAISETIRELGQVPSGVLYARLMGHLSFEAYEKIIGILSGAGVIRCDGSHVIKWIGGAK